VVSADAEKLSANTTTVQVLPKEGDGVGVLSKRILRVQPCYVEAASSLQSGPWSIEWLRSVQKGDVGLISSNKKRHRKFSKGVAAGVVGNKITASKRKAGGVLRHPVHTLKKVARLPSSDREEVLKALKDSKVMKVLKQKICSRRRRRERVTKSLEEAPHISFTDSEAAASVNNDWLNWVALKGGEEAKADDLNEIGKTIGVSFNGTTHNKFAALSRNKKVIGGPVLASVVHENVEEDGAV
jgi:hypothetical protein